MSKTLLLTLTIMNEDELTELRQTAAELRKHLKLVTVALLAKGGKERSDRNRGIGFKESGHVFVLLVTED